MGGERFLKYLSWNQLEVCLAVTQEELIRLLNELRALPSETEWVEFKLNYVRPKEIGEYLSALSNSACLHNKEKGYLVFGIENQTHRVVGTSFEPTCEKLRREVF
jgi:ATP-dependent DNA helicase RecG